ncbi:MAG: hypothetical protein F9K40_09835 [Kofleriaceae bacterium]|nr:MAG: hypothetical protein F9K40_09835 [Kofleriaceae bacterium]MBZ0230854.1 hypothetical protein [Kofleriaceae bacterium]
MGIDVLPHASVDAFFHEVLTDALESTRVGATEPAGWYLVSLLGDFTRARLPDEPLAVKLAQSAAADPGERVKTLKEVGDTSLYLAGFFAESLSRKLVDADYYIGLGRGAYAELAGRLGSTPITEVYRELAEGFPGFVEVLAEVRRRVDFAGADVMKLYEHWVRSRDAWIEKKLRALGVLVDPGGKVIQ